MQAEVKEPSKAPVEPLKTADAAYPGLSSQEAAARQARAGPNEPAPARRRSLLLQILAVFSNPLVIILLIASLVSGLLGEPLNSMIIVIMVLLSWALNFFQTYRSQQAAAKLRETVTPVAEARRDGTWAEIPRRSLVPGDLIRVSAGNLVPADARLIEATDLHAQQAALTGESMPVLKQAVPEVKDGQPGQEGQIFLGTSIVSGSGTAIVTATGRETVFGDIAVRLAARPPETEFERGTRKFGLLITQTVFFLVLFVFLVSAALRHDALESLLFAVALAVGLTPEFLPMITAVTLSQGAVHMSRRKVIVKNLEAIQNFGSIDILCSDKTGTITSGVMKLDRHIDPLGNSTEKVLEFGYLNSFFETGIKNPLDAAIIQHEVFDTAPYRKISEIPFDFERRRLSIVVERDGQRMLITKGAPEGVLPLCREYESGGTTYPLDEAARQRCQATYDGLSQEGYRVVAVGYAPVAPQATYHGESNLVLLGYLAFYDPPLEGARNALETLRRDGIMVKILTGDNEKVARHVCAQVGLDDSRVVLGEEIDRMNDAALAHVAEQNTIFARVSPGQKNRIIMALKARSHVVGYIGDGINDAPSLHAADVGISVASGVEVAQDAAEIILLEHSLTALHAGIIEGRKAFGNVMKYLLMGTSSNFGNMFSMAGAALFLPFLPMLPTQILLNNFLYDMAQVTIPSDNVDSSYIHKPRRWDIRTIRKFMLFIGPISSIYDFLTFFIMLYIFNAGQELFHTGWFVESLATQTLVLFVIRTAGNPFKSRPSRPLTITTLAIVAVGLILPFSPLAGSLGFVALPALYFLFLAAMTTTYLLLVELVKRRLMGQLVK